MRAFTEILASSDSTATAFPFGFVIDEELKVVEFGRSLPAILPLIQVGDPITQHLCLDKPSAGDGPFTAPHLLKHLDSLFIFRIHSTQTRVRAECFFADGRFAFNASPAISSVNILQELGLSFSHFSLIDSIGDSVFLWSMQEQTIRETERIAQELSASNKELQSEVERRQAIELERQQLQEDLLVASRDAGKAEVATGVLHDVGNVMNSVNVTTGMLFDKTDEKILRQLQATHTVLQQHQHDLPAFFASSRGAHFVPFVSELVSEAESILEMIMNLRCNINQVNAVVSAQQSYATTSGVQSTVDLHDIVDAAIGIVTAGYQAHGIVVEREFDALPNMTIDKPKILQVLVNLFRNAEHAIVDQQGKDRRVTVKTRLTNSGDARIEIVDTGIGISEDNLARLFQHGFSTRIDRGGHGFGLHHSYFAVEQLGGSITACSPGEGQGATFAVELPLHQPPAVTQAEAPLAAALQS